MADRLYAGAEPIEELFAWITFFFLITDFLQSSMEKILLCSANT